MTPREMPPPSLPLGTKTDIPTPTDRVEENHRVKQRNERRQRREEEQLKELIQDGGSDDEWEAAKPLKSIRRLIPWN